MGKKKVRAVLKIELQAGKATPAPPVGTALGPHGVNIMEFCRSYNERTAQQAGDVAPAHRRPPRPPRRAPRGRARHPPCTKTMKFCRSYNERTAQQAGDVVPAEI